MDLTFGKEELAFQQEVRGWLKENLTPEIVGEMKVGRNAYMPKERLVDWQKRLAKKGWLCTGWPKEFGGPGFTTTQKYIFEMEMAKAGAPGTSPFGPKMCAPVIMKYGSAEQKARHLPPMLNSDLIWCQGYSEPGSGSDLASLRTKAVRDGDHYIVNGQKTWTTLAQTADWIFCLVRTSNEGKPQEGISFLLIDMKTPGISVEPIITADGNRAGTQEVNSVFFTDVKVPVENRVGEENKGWTYAKYLLEFERGGNPVQPAPALGLRAAEAAVAGHAGRRGVRSWPTSPGARSSRAWTSRSPAWRCSSRSSIRGWRRARTRGRCRR